MKNEMMRKLVPSAALLMLSAFAAFAGEWPRYSDQLYGPKQYRPLP